MERMNEMRFCIPIPCFFGNLDFCDALRKVASLGFDAAETYRWKDLELDKVRAVCKETGVELISMCTSEFNMTSPENREVYLAALRESCEAAKRVGAAKLITQVGPDTGAERAFQHESIVSTLRAAVPILESYGVTLMIEPLNTFVDHPGYYLTSAAEAFDMIREADSPFVKVVYDMYHQQIMEGNIIPSVTKNLGLIAHLHAAGHPGRHELQSGELNYAVVFDAIDKAGYVGACGLEYFPVLPPEESLQVFKKLYL